MTEIKQMVIEELRAENEALRRGVDFYEEVLRLRAQTWADAKQIDELTDQNRRLREIVFQYRDDLMNPPAPDSLVRRMNMIEGMLK